MNFIKFFNSFFLLIILIWYHHLMWCNANNECDRTRIWGPGLDPENIVMPARYFFIETASQNNTRSQDNNVFDVKISGNNGKPCRIWINILDRKDGSFIVRYKVYEICFRLTISVKCHGKEIQNFPYTFRGITYPDECSCNVNKNIDQWLKNYGCKKSYQQISTDLKPFNEIDFNQVHSVAQENLFKEGNRYSVCNYVIRNNLIHRACYGQHTGFKMFIDAILLSITRKVHLPDLEMLVNLGDWPLIKTTANFNNKKILIPIFSWCGSDETLDIVLPTYDITESSLENMGRVSLDMLSVQGNIGRTWENKIPKLFWRGRDSSRERLKLIEIGRKHSHLINASLTNFFFFKELENEYGPKEERISFFKFFDFKYQMNMDGTVAAYRFPYLLVSDSLIFKQDSTYYEHFYSDLKKWKHFIPVKRDLSDLTEKIKWAIEHDDEARNIALESQRYARNNLLPQDIFCYHVQLLHEYSKKLGNKTIEIRPNMKPVHQNNYPQCSCNSNELHEEF